MCYFHIKHTDNRLASNKDVSYFMENCLFIFVSYNHAIFRGVACGIHTEFEGSFSMKYETSYSTSWY